MLVEIQLKIRSQFKVSVTVCFDVLWTDPLVATSKLKDSDFGHIEGEQANSIKRAPRPGIKPTAFLFHDSGSGSAM